MGKICLSFGSGAVMLFCTYAGVAAALKDTVSSPWYLSIILIASVIAGIAFVVTGVIYLWQYISSRKKFNKKAEKEASHRALVEAFKRSGMTDEMAEVAATGRPPGPYVEGLDDDGWITPREAYEKHKKNS